MNATLTFEQRIGKAYIQLMQDISSARREMYYTEAGFNQRSDRHWEYIRNYQDLMVTISWTVRPLFNKS